MKLINYLVLKCCNQIKIERTIYSIYHLFTGRRSIQTLQDAHLYELTHFYGVYKKLPIDEFDTIIAELIAKNLIQQVDSDDSRYLITSQGKEILVDFDMPIKINGLLYEQYSNDFYQRLLLFIQVWTNSKQKNGNYIPVIENYKVERFIKTLYINRKERIESDLKNLYGELSNIFKEIPSQQVDLYVDRLSGYHYYGLSVPQLTEKYETDKHTIHLSIVSINHLIIENVINNPKSYKLLSLLLETLLTEKRLTRSTHKTYDLFKKGYNLTEIANIRQLKLNTIYDHIVEVSLYDQSFPINKFVPLFAQEEIIDIVRKHKTFKLKEIKDNISAEINYFQIRLVLSMMSNAEVGGQSEFK